MSKSQNYANHGRLVPPFHFFALPVLLVNVIWQIYRLVGEVTGDRIVSLLLALALVVVALYARVFALRAQDRLIRLEMRLRMRELLPADLGGRINDFTVEQLIGLRFAGDRELPDLAARVLTDDIRDRTTIKKLVVDWLADDCRV